MSPEELARDDTLAAMARARPHTRANANASAHPQAHPSAWVFDRGPTARALPAALALPGEALAVTEARRLHPAMIQNVWDAQRLVTGLLHTPAFTKGRHRRRHGHHGHPPGGGDATGAGSATAAAATAATAATAVGGLGAGLESGDLCGCGARLLVKNPEACSPTVVQPALVQQLPNPHWPCGYPRKGRLVHWAEPCDFAAG